jgi:tetratricopeptide (TPR) repeat protein
MTPIRLPWRVYAVLSLIALAGALALALTYPPDRLIGQMFETDGEYDRSIAAFSTWDQRHPLDYEARWHTIQLLLETARPKEAVELLESMHQEWPQDARVIERLAEIEDGRLDVERSMHWTEVLAQIQPNNASLLRRLADAYRWFGRSDDEERMLERALETAGDEEDHHELIDLLLARRKYDELVRFYTAYAAKRPDAIEPHLALYQAYLRSGDKDRALSELEQVIRRHPEDNRSELAQEFFELRVQQLLSRGQFEAAVDLFKARIAADPTDLSLRLHFASIYGKREDEIAAAQLKELVGLVPGSGPAWKAYAQRLSWTNRPREASEAFLRALELLPRDAVVHRGLADSLSAIDKKSEALEQFRWLDSKGLGTTADRREMLEILADLGRNEEAVSLALEQIRRAPGRKEDVRVLARAAVRAKRCDRAFDVLREATERFPRDPESWSLYGLCAKQLGHTSEALEALNKASKLHKEAR